MSRYALLNEAVSAVIDIKEDSDTRYAERAGLNSEYGRRWRLLVVDAQPSVTATQIAEQNSRLDQLVIEATQVRVTWSVRDLTQAEMDITARNVERDALLANVALFLDSPAPSTAGDAFVAVQRLKRVCKWLFEQVRLRGSI